VTVDKEARYGTGARARPRCDPQPWDVAATPAAPRRAETCRCGPGWASAPGPQNRLQPPASQHQALALFRDFGDRLGQAEALNRLGELSSRTSATSRARDQHTRALAIARDISVPLEQAHALEGPGRSHLQDGDHREGLDYLRQALTIYQQIGAPVQRVQETLQRHGQPSTTPESQPTAPTSDGYQPSMPTAPSESQ
jgi:hypothetical protein